MGGVPTWMANPYNPAYQQQRGQQELPYQMPDWGKLGNLAMNPAVGLGVGALEGLFGYLAGGGQRRRQQEMHNKRMDLFNYFGKLHRTGGPVIDPGQMRGMTSQWRQGMQPAFNQMQHSAARHTNLASPEAHRMYLQQRMPLESQFLGGLNRQNIQMGQQRDMQLRQLMAMLMSGGGN